MPYITPEHRRLLDVEGWYASCPGDLNYQFSALIADYWKHNPSYQTINDVIGALEGAKLEFYRRVAVPYENTKLCQNGDVYS
jgi:hypothetical protein